MISIERDSKNERRHLFCYISPCYHVHHFTLRDLRTLLGRSGFGLLWGGKVATCLRVPREADKVQCGVEHQRSVLAESDETMSSGSFCEPDGYGANACLGSGLKTFGLADRLGFPVRGVTRVQGWF